MTVNEKLYFNGDIITLENELYAEAVLVKDGKIFKVGKKDDLLKSACKDVELVDLQGKTLIPSFIDSHSHFFGYANSTLQVNLDEAINFEEIADKITNFIQKNNVEEGVWISCSNFDYNGLEEKTYPKIDFLDKIAPKNPLVISNKSGHNGLFNSLAFKELGIDENTPNPEGGIFFKENGKLNGYAEENAFIEYIQKVPMASTEDIIKAIGKAQDAYASYGITTVQEGMVVTLLADFLLYIANSNILKIDYVGYADIVESETILGKLGDYKRKYKNHFKLGGYKTFLDGSPQGRTAWMRTPYEGEADYYAYGTQKDEELKGKLIQALKEDMQMLVHCNGDRACQQYIDMYRLAKEESNSNNDIRPVIIHAQLLGEDQLDEVKELNMIPSFFVGHVYHWGDVHIKNFGMERASKISLLKSAEDKGITFTLHQDAPVIEPNMLETIWIAVTRRTKNGVSLGPEERIEPLEALKAVTKNAAYQYFEEDIKGTIKEGKLADLAILDKNPLKVDHEAIRDIQVLETIKEGKTIFKR